MVEFYFSALNFTLAQTIALLTGGGKRGTIIIPVPIEVFQTMFFSQEDKFGFNYSEYLFTLSNLSRALLEVKGNGDGSFMGDVFDYTVSQSGAVATASDVSNRTAWETAFKAAAAGIFTTLDAKCQSFDSTDGTDADLTGKGPMYFPSGSPKNLAEIVAATLNQPATTVLTYMPIKIDDMIAFDITVNLAGTTNSGGPISSVVYRVNLVATNLQSNFPNSSVQVNNIFSSEYGLMDTYSYLVEYNSLGQTCIINGISYSLLLEDGDLDIFSFYNNFGIYIQQIDNYAIISIERKGQFEDVVIGPSLDPIFGAVVEDKYLSKTRFLSYIPTSQGFTVQTIPRCRSSDENYEEDVPDLQLPQNKIILYSKNQRNFYVNDAGDSLSAAYTFFNFSERLPISAKVILKYDAAVRNTLYAPTFNIFVPQFSPIDSSLPSASDTTLNYFNYEIIDVTGTMQNRSIELNNANCTTFGGLAGHIEDLISLSDEIHFMFGEGYTTFSFMPKTDLIVIVSASITCLAPATLVPWNYTYYHPHHRVVSTVPVLSWTVLASETISPFVNNSFVMPPGTYNVLDIAGILRDNVTGVRCYVVGDKYLIIEKLTSFLLFSDILNIVFANKFGFLADTTTVTYIAWTYS